MNDPNKYSNVASAISLLKEQEGLLKLRHDVFELKLKVLNSQMNPHFVFNALNAVQFFIASENKQSALEYFSIFSKLLRHYMKHFDTETVKLSDEIAMLNGYLKLQKLRYGNQFEFHLMIPKPRKKNLAVIPSFILQTLFENVIEQGIYNQQCNQVITTNFKITKTQVTINLAYSFYSTDELKNTYIPEYREPILHWQEHIHLLNALKNYGIKKKVTINKNGKLHGGNVLLTLPNLI